MHAGITALGLAIALAAGCSRDRMPAEPSAATTAPFASEHFTFHATTLDGDTVPAIAAALEAERDRIIGDLGAGAMPRVSVYFYADHAALERAVTPVVGPIPSWSSGLVTGPDQIHMMSPSAPQYGPMARAVSNLVHEFAHCVSLQVNRSIGNNPRWLWESIAVYESGQQVDPRTLPYMRDLNPPRFAAMSSFDNAFVYEVGYTIGEFIVDRGGREALNTLIRSRGDVAASFGMDLETFEARWFTFVRDRYQF